MKKHLKDFFIPYEGNDYTPHSLQKAAVSGMVVLVLLSFTLANLQSALWVASDWMISTVLPAVIVDLTNEERADDALSELRRNTTLDQAAELKAQHMAQNEYFAHFSPDGVSPWHWFGKAKYSFVHAGENLAIHFTDSGDVVDAWMDSPTHRANILNGNYTEIGVGTAEGMFDGYKTVYVVQMFGTPAAQPSVTGTNVAQIAEIPEVEEIPEAVVVEEIDETTEVAVQTPPAVETEETQEEAVVLAEEIAITEDVVIVAAESEPVEVVVATPETDTTVENMEVTEYGVALFSDHVSTSTGGVPASIDPTQSEPVNESSYVMQLLTQPHLILQMLYIAIGAFVLIALLMSLLIETRKHQPIQVAYSMALMILMFGMFYMHTVLSSGFIV